MKKIIAIVMIALMLLAVLAPAASATTSPVKKYADAKAGELLYTVDFRGNDGAITLGSAGGANDKGHMDYTVIDNGAGVQIKAKSTAVDSQASLWGGIIKDLEATNQTIYSMVYKAKAEGEWATEDDAKNNSVGVGGWVVSEAAFQTTGGIYNVYANHNTKVTTGGVAADSVNQRTALSNGTSKIGASEQPDKGYVFTKNMPAIDVDADGYVTALVVYNGTTKKFANYYLKAGATNLNAEASWLKFDEREMTAALDGTNTNYMCFWTYTFYKNINTTIKNVQYYKEYLWSLKKYDDAKPGDLLYTVNFNGDAEITLGSTGANDMGHMNYTVVENGAGVHITPKTGIPADKMTNLWGGLIKNLEATDQTIYSMVYKAKANGTYAKNNSVGVGGWSISEAGFGKTTGVYNVYANHNTQDANGPSADQRTALSDGILKFGEKIDYDPDGKNGYKFTKDLPAYDVDDDGYVTALVVFNGKTGKFANYMLKDGATDLKAEASWIKFDERSMYSALNGTDKNYMCFWTYTYYNTIDTVIKDVQYYKDALWADPNAVVVTPPASNNTTTAPTTTAPTTTKPATTTAAAEEEKGCGGTITVAGIALVASLGTCAVYVEKKRRK